MKIRLEKLQKELSRGNAAEQYEVLKQLKEFIVSSIEKEKVDLQNNANGLQSLINEINSNAALSN